MPLRKRNVYEEVARFLDIPGGQEIVQESYAQLRKFNCWNISIVQQYARFKQSRIRSAVFGNSRQFFIMRQNDRADLDDMGKDIALPEVTQHAIMNYPLPDHQSGQKYSPFTYFHTDSGRNLCGTAHNISSREMLYCSSSSGEHFDKRARELRQSPNIVEGIIAHANSTQIIQNQNAYEKILIQFIPLACAVCLFTGCAAVTRTTTDVGLGAGGAALGGELSHNNPYAIAAARRAGRCSVKVFTTPTAS